MKSSVALQRQGNGAGQEEPMATEAQREVVGTWHDSAATASDSASGCSSGSEHASDDEGGSEDELSDGGSNNEAVDGEDADIIWRHNLCLDYLRNPGSQADP